MQSDTGEPSVVLHHPNARPVHRTGCSPRKASPAGAKARAVSTGQREGGRSLKGQTPRSTTDTKKRSVKAASLS